MNKKNFLPIVIIISSLVFVFAVNSAINEGTNENQTTNFSSTYTPYSETHCLNNKCNITFYSHQKFIEENGTWQTITEVMDFNWLENYFRLSYKKNPNIFVDIQPIFYYNNGNNYTVQDVKQIFPNANIKDRVDKSRFGYKFALNLTVPENLVNNTNYIAFKIINVSGLTWEDVHKENHSLVIKDKYAISYGDLLESGFTLSHSGKEVRIGNLSANYINGVLNLDPSITFNDSSGTITEDVTFDEDSARNGASATMVLDTIDGTGEMPIIKFDLTGIPAGQTITNATFSVYHPYGAGSNLAYDYWYGSNQTWVESNVDGVVCSTVWCENLRTAGFMTTKLGSKPNCPADDWSYMDVTSAVQTEMNIGINRNVTFVMNQSGDGSDYAYVASKEYTAISDKEPQLYVEYEPAPTNEYNCDFEDDEGVNSFINCSRYCNVTSYTPVGGNVTFAGEGNITISAELNFTEPDCYIFVRDKCEIHIGVGGKIN